MYYEVVPSPRNVGGYRCEAINHEDEGTITIVEFYSHDSKALAEEYAEWKNSTA